MYKENYLKLLKRTIAIIFLSSTISSADGLSAYLGKFSSSFSEKGSEAKTSTKLLKKQLGKKYVWGATGPKTFDCSGLTTYAFKKKGVKIPRRAIQQSKVGKKVSRKNLKKGDLVFFDTSKRKKGFVNHVGIYLGNNKFIHASSAKKKVIITSLNKSFYKNRFKWGRRL